MPETQTSQTQIPEALSANSDSDSHVIISVPNVGRVAFPAEMPPADIHAAILDHLDSQAPDLGQSASQPSANDVLETQDNFRKAASDAWAATRNGTKNEEAGFAINKDGSAGPVSVNQGIHGTFQVPSSSMALFHTHPNLSTSDPSPTDIATAKKVGKTIYVGSREGLFAVDPSGNVTHIYKNDEWQHKAKR
jgi:hypothetical protein